MISPPNLGQIDLLQGIRLRLFICRIHFRSLCILKKSRDNKIYTMQYPVIGYPEKIKAINLDKQPEIKSVLTGIKGQYLIFKNGNVLNIRKHSGYFITIKII